MSRISPSSAARRTFFFFFLPASLPCFFCLLSRDWIPVLGPAPGKLKNQASAAFVCSCSVLSRSSSCPCPCSLGAGLTITDGYQRKREKHTRNLERHTVNRTSRRERRRRPLRPFYDKQSYNMGQETLGDLQLVSGSDLEFGERPPKSFRTVIID